MCEKMEIKKASMEDFEQLMELKLKLKESEKKFLEESPDLSETGKHFEKYLKEYLSKENCAVFAAAEGSKIIGMISAKIYYALPTHNSEKRGYLSNLFVEKEFRKKKVGSKLAEKAIDWLKSQGAKTVRGEIYCENTASIEFCKSLGFKEYSLKIFKEL